MPDTPEHMTWRTQDQAAKIAKLGAKYIKAIREQTLEEAAKTAEAMVISGRAWTHDQQVAANALLNCAKNIRRLIKS